MSGPVPEQGVMMGGAAELRKAAETLRTLVGGLDPWGDDAEDAGCATWADCYSVAPSAFPADRAERVYIATMHPGVGLAFAAMLDFEAELVERLGLSEDADLMDHNALHAARLINRSSDSAGTDGGAA